MKLKQQLSLSPLQKYKKYGKYPYKAVITIFLVLLNTFQLLDNMKANIYRNNDQFQQFVSLYFDPDIYMDTMFADSQNFFIRNLQQFNNHFKYIQNSFQNIHTKSLQYINFDNSTVQIIVHQYYFNGQDINNKLVYNINIGEGFSGPESPFDVNDSQTLKDFFSKVSCFELIVSNIDLEYHGYYLKWENKILYQFSNRAEIVMTIVMQPQKHDYSYPEENANLELSTFVNFLILILATISLFLNYKYLMMIVLALYQYQKNIYLKSSDQPQRFIYKQKTQYQNTIDWLFQNSIPLRALNWQDLLQIIDVWTIISTLGNIMQILSTIFLVFRSDSTVMIGIACLLSWLVIFQYIKKYKQMVLLNEVLSMSIPKILLSMIQFFPTFMAFLVFGRTVFWRVDLFSTIRRTLATQMCLLLGDSISLITQSICQFHSVWIAIYYSFSFVLLFMQAIQNLLVSLIKQQFILNKIILARKKLREEGMQSYLAVHEIKMSGQQQKQRLPIKFSKNYQQQIMRKQLKRNQDRLIIRIQKFFNLVELQIKIMVRDFNEDLQYSQLNIQRINQAREEFQKQLLRLTSITEKLGNKLKKFV